MDNSIVRGLIALALIIAVGGLVAHLYGEQQYQAGATSGAHDLCQEQGLTWNPPLGDEVQGWCE